MKARSFALVMLVADVWLDTQSCVPFVLGKAGKAKALALKGPVSAILEQLKAEGAKGVSLKGGGQAVGK